MTSILWVRFDFKFVMVVEHLINHYVVYKKLKKKRPNICREHLNLKKFYLKALYQ